MARKRKSGGRCYNKAGKQVSCKRQRAGKKAARKGKRRPRGLSGCGC